MPLRPILRLLLAGLLACFALLTSLALDPRSPFLVPTVAHAADPGDWPMFRHDPAHTGYNPDQARVAASRAGATVMFIENVGQLKEGARFQVPGSNGAIYLAEDSISFTAMRRSAAQLQPKTQDLRKRAVNLEVSFPGANPHPRLETRVSYFTGNDPAKWHADVPVWGACATRTSTPV